MYIGVMDTENGTTYSIEELSDLTGFDRRTIRSYIEQGLLSGPVKMGRYAQYAPEHLSRLLAIKFMRESDGFTTGVIRTRLLTMTKEEVDRIALESVGSSSSERNSQTSALEYLSAIQGDGSGPAKPGSDMDRAFLAQRLKVPASASDTDSGSPIERLGTELSEILNGRNVRRQASAETWHRIEVTPDVEISVRGLSDRELSRMERIADHLREILLGGI